MYTKTLRARMQRVAVTFTAAVLISACGLDKQTQPSLIGPADGGLSITMTASPDSLPRDGSSQSVITLVARDSQGRPVRGQRLSLSLGVNAPQGATLSISEATTDGNGQATFTVGAPIAGSVGDITVLATPMGTDASNSLTRRISIRALPQNNSSPQFPTPPFNVSCASGQSNCTTDPEVGQVVTFDATGVTDEGVTCNSCLFAWNFGGEGTATGQIVSHAFGSAGTYVVTLTVTDGGGLSNNAQRNLNVTSPGPASVDFTFVPATPTAGQTATFTSTAAAASNHRIVSSTWAWGDGSANQSTTSTTIQHIFDKGGVLYPVIFPVTLTVRDDLGQTATTTKSVTVTSGLTPVITVSPSGSVVVGRTIYFDASASTSSTGTAIVNYLFDFGDGTTQTGSFSTAKHEYDTAGSYTVRLTITDDKGRMATTTTLGNGAGAGNVTITN